MTGMTETRNIRRLDRPFKVRNSPISFVNVAFDVDQRDTFEESLN